MKSDFITAEEAPNPATSHSELIMPVTNAISGISSGLQGTLATPATQGPQTMQLTVVSMTFEQMVHAYYLSETRVKDLQYIPDAELEDIPDPGSSDAESTFVPNTVPGLPVSGVKASSKSMPEGKPNPKKQKKLAYYAQHLVMNKMYTWLISRQHMHHEQLRDFLAREADKRDFKMNCLRSYNLGLSETTPGIIRFLTDNYTGKCVVIRSDEGRTQGEIMIEISNRVNRCVELAYRTVGKKDPHFKFHLSTSEHGKWRTMLNEMLQSCGQIFDDLLVLHTDIRPPEGYPCTLNLTFGYYVTLATNPSVQLTKLDYIQCAYSGRHTMEVHVTG